MNQRGKKLQPKLALDMPFEEALARFSQVKPAELKEAIRRAKETEPEPSNGKPPAPPARRKRH